MLGRKDKYLYKTATASEDTALMMEQLASDVRQLTYVVRDLTEELESMRRKKNAE